MKLPLRAPPGHLEALELPKDVYPSRLAAGNQKGYSRAFQMTADAHIGRTETQVFEEVSESHP